MRWRILAAMLGLLAAAAVLVVVPVLALVSEDRTRELVTSRATALERVAELARSADEGRSTAALQRYLDRHHELLGESAVVVGLAGAELAGAGDADVRAALVEQRRTAYGYTLPQLSLGTVHPWSPDTALMSVPVEVDEIGGGTAVLQVDLRPARTDVREAWLAVLGAALAVTAVLVAGALVVVRWVLRPVAELDRAAHDLAGGAERGGGPSAVAAPQGPPELRRLASAFWEMVGVLTLALRQQRDLLAHTSHNLRNPLAAVRLRIDLLAQAAEPDLRDQLHGVQDDLDRLDGLVEGLLLLAHAEHEGSRRRAAALGGGAPPEGVSSLLDPAAVARRWAERAQRAGALVVGEGEAAGVAVPQRDLEVVVDALVDNAMKYGGPGGRVVVAVVVEEADDAADGADGTTTGGGAGLVLLAVDDDGPGLPPEDLARAGERFWRSEQHAQRPGTGLGLAIVTDLAQAHGGRVHLSASERGGLRAEVRLPLPAGEGSWDGHDRSADRDPAGRPDAAVGA